MNWLILFLLAAPLCAQKQQSTFFPQAVRDRAVANANTYDWAAKIRKQAIADAARWRNTSDEELWSYMFGPSITRSHMVWSSGFCPKCRKPVPMYDWQIDALARPWKARCPHCNEQFPKNDFEKFYRSGLDEHALFDPRRADRKLLFNTEHPDPADQLHLFGVDDGEGYVEGKNRWRFIGAYLLYGQWTQRVEGAMNALSTAYTVTGDPVYAHKAAVLIDRIADVWPTFDYAEQGLVYERARYGGGVAGYVWYAITSAITVREIVSAYDKIFDGVRNDAALIAFLKSKDSRKQSFTDIQRNIETNILRHVLDHPAKIRSNYPWPERTLSMIHTVLEWPSNRDELRKGLDEITRKAVAVDGVSGEKGLDSYGTIAPRELGLILEEYARLDPGLLPDLLARNPKLRQTYHFHFDTWINGKYYPNTGDAGAFAKQASQYVGLTFPSGDSAYESSIYSFLRRMGKATGDPFFAQLAWNGNGNKADGLPHDIFAEDPGLYAEEVKQTIAREGVWPKVGSVNKQEWRIAILRHRTAPDAAVWLDYDSVPEGPLKSHYHFDAMNLGLFAKGLDLLPEYGYPAVQFGDWHTPQALWHKKTAAHNTVVVDGKDQFGGPTESTYWSAGGECTAPAARALNGVCKSACSEAALCTLTDELQAIRASSPAQIKGKVYERTVAMVETGPADFYVFDVFRVTGGTDHAKMTHTTFASAQPTGLRLAKSPDFGNNTLMRGFQTDADPVMGWNVDWKIEDKYNYNPKGRDVHLRYFDLTRGVEASLAESWTVASATSTTEYWIPTVMARRRSKTGELSSTFVSLLDPYESKQQIKRVTRLDQEGDATVRVEVELNDGRRDTLTSGPDGVKLVRAAASGR